MTIDHTTEYLIGLIHEFCKLPNETEWVEFKAHYVEPQEIGEYISALANSAALYGKAFAYLAWGIEDKTHDIVGTDFKPSSFKIGNEELENWLLRLLEPKIHFRFYEFDVDMHHLVLLEIGRAFRHPVRFQGLEYIRVGSYKKKLKDFPEKERELWRIFDKMPFEDLVAVEGVASDEAFKLIDYPSYFDLLKLPLPNDKNSILQALASDELIRQTEGGMWNITNLGAILFAKKLSDFRSLKRKAVRVIVYKGTSRVETIREQEGAKGYASGFEGLISFVSTLLPSNEVIEKALRKTVPMFPELAVRNRSQK